jgi:hypothetical protein
MRLFEQGLQLVLQPRSVTRELIPCAGDCAPEALALGTKLKISSPDTSRLIKRSQSTKSFLRPRRPRFDKACARCRLPDFGPAVFRF